jgi:hypothetical protein
MAAFDLKRKVNDSAQREHENAAKAFLEMPEEEEQQQQHEVPPEEEQLTETIKVSLWFAHSSQAGCLSRAGSTVHCCLAVCSWACWG